MNLLNYKILFKRRDPRKTSIVVFLLHSQSKFISKSETVEKNGKDEINIDYLTRRYVEIMENPFLSRKIAIRHIEALVKSIGKDKLSLHFSYIAAFMFNILSSEKLLQEEKLFLEYLKNKKLVSPFQMMLMTSQMIIRLDIKSLKKMI